MTRNLARTARRRRRLAKKRKRIYEPHYFTPAGPVTIKKADGSVEFERPLNPDELRRVVKQREVVTASMRQRVLKRDKGKCRYCGCSIGPFHIDHVTPVASGGSSKMGNLVTACDTCNTRKGTKIWDPKPIR